MHSVTKFDIKNCCNEYVVPAIIDQVEKLKQDYLANKNDKDKYLKLLYNIPSGFRLTARMTTNYRQLKTIYSQRYSHRLPEWRQFCKEMLNLPLFETLCFNGDAPKPDKRKVNSNAKGVQTEG